MAVTNSGMTLYADNDSQESWSGTDDLDDYNMSIQGTNSESWTVAKNAIETGTLALIAAMGTPKYFTLWMKSDIANYYIDIEAILRDSSSNTLTFTVADSTDPDVSGDFHPSVLQLSEGTASGTYVPNNHDEFEVVIDNSTSGNIRSVTNNWIDTLHYGDGRTISGTTASDKLFLESHTADTTTADEFDGCSELYKGSLAFQTDVIVDTTTGNSYGEVITFAYARNTDNAYTLFITGTADFKGTNIIGSGATVALVSSSATAFSMAGGGVTNFGTLTFAAGQTIGSAVFNTGGASTIPNTISNSTFETTGLITITGVGELDTCTINNGTGASAVSCANLNDVPDCIFVSDGTGHAVELTGAAASYTWSCVCSGGYDTGSTGDGVEVTDGDITGDEHIHITATTGTFIISVAAGATTPSVSTAGAIVNVSAGLVKLTLTGLIADSEVRIYEHGTTTEVAGVEDSTTTFEYDYTFAASTYIDIVVHKADYKYVRVDNYLLGSGDASLPIQQIFDRNYSNP